MLNSKIILFNEAFIYSLLNHLQYNLEYDYVKKTLLFTSKGEFREIFSLPFFSILFHCSECGQFWLLWLCEDGVEQGHPPPGRLPCGPPATGIHYTYSTIGWSGTRTSSSRQASLWTSCHRYTYSTLGRSGTRTSSSRQASLWTSYHRYTLYIQYNRVEWTKDILVQAGFPVDLLPQV